MDMHSPDVLPSVGGSPQKAETTAPVYAPEMQTRTGAEKPGAIAVEHAAGSPGAPPAATPMMPLTASPGQMGQPALGAVGIVPTPQIADDADLIEKEWVEKAKNIVNQTRDNPYMQNKEMNRVKADYLKKRFNRDVKLSED